MSQSNTEYAAFIGIDWADTEHAFCLQAGEDAPQAGTLLQTPEDIHQWVADLRQRFGGRPVAIALEQSKGALIYALLGYDFLVLFPINPAKLSSYREAFSAAGAKDDPTDAALLLDYLRKFHDRLTPWKPDDVATRTLSILVSDRRKLVDQRTALSNQLKDQLKRVFPQAVDLVGDDLSTPLATDFLLRWPTLQQLKRSKMHTLRKFYFAHNSRKTDTIDKRLAIIQNATPLTDDPALLETGQRLIQSLVALLRPLTKAIADYDRRIRELFQAHPDRSIFAALPGAGAQLAPRMLTAFGTDRQRFENAADVQKVVGIAPVTKRSGKSCFVIKRWACPKFVRQSFHEFANCSRHYSTWAQRYYQQQRDRGSAHHTAIRALAFKWIRIIFHCWKHRVQYDESVYLEALKHRGSSLANNQNQP